MVTFEVSVHARACNIDEDMGVFGLQLLQRLITRWNKDGSTLRLCDCYIILVGPIVIFHGMPDGLCALWNVSTVSCNAFLRPVSRLNKACALASSDAMMANSLLE